MKIRYFTKRDRIWIDFRDAEGTRHRVPTPASTEAEAAILAPNIIAKALSAPSTTASVTPVDVTQPRKCGKTLREAFDSGFKLRDSWVRCKDRKSKEFNFGGLLSTGGMSEDMDVAVLTRDKVLELRSLWIKQPGKRAGELLAASTINHRLSMASVLLELVGCPPHTVKHLSVKGSRRERRISDQEVSAMRDWLMANAHRVGAVRASQLITVAVLLGARLAELLKAPWPDVRDGLITFRDTKNGTHRTVPVPEPAQRVLDHLRESGVAGGPFHDLSEDRMEKLWAMARKALGLASDRHFVFHSLRHECLSRLSDSGEASAGTIQAIAGHESITTTQRYIHASLGAMKAAMGITTPV